MRFYTITIGDNCFDLPKDMPIPQKGSVVFVGNCTGIVDQINYHVIDGKLHMISIFATVG